MNNFSEFEKMPKSLTKLGLDEKALSELSKLKWVVTEKVHGANFSIVYENRKLLFAKRKAYLTWNDDFFGFQEVVSRIEENVLQLFEHLGRDIRAEKFIIYGELFGGKYPHAEVDSHPDLEAIQTGVYYSPTIEFCAFDIAFEINEIKQYLDYEKAVDYFEKYEIFYAKVLFAGKLNEAMDFDLKIDSSIPLQLNLPKIDNNMIEGIVIKPLNHSTLKNLESRPIFKLKNAEFDEDDKFHEAKKWSFIPKVSSKSEELSFLVEEMRGYINENRINSAASKIGKLDFDNEQRLEEIREEVLNDVWNDFNLANDDIVNDLDTEKHIWIKQRLTALINDQIFNSR